MFRKIAENVVSCAVSMIAVYVVAKLAYKAGNDMANMENRYKAMAEKTMLMEKKTKALTEKKGEMLDQKPKDEDILVTEVIEPTKKGGILSGLRKKVSVIGDLMKDPDGHRMEACINGDAVDIRIQKR